MEPPTTICRGMRSRPGLLNLAAILAVLFTSSAMMRAQQSPDPYPFAVGNYWIYQLHGTELSGPDWLPVTVEKTWRTEITQVVYRKGGIEPGEPGSPSIAAAVFDNFPDRLFISQLHNFNAPTCGGPCILISVNSRKFYAIYDDRPSSIAAILRRVRDPNDNLSDLLTEDTQILDLPLAVGKSWGPPPECNHPEAPQVCVSTPWAVTGRDTHSLIGVRGAGAASNWEGFVVETYGRGSEEEFSFVPGIGITHHRWEVRIPYSGRGEEEFTLVEVHLNQTKAAAPR